MSLKANFFRASVPQLKTADMFVVHIEGLDISPVRCLTASLPSKWYEEDVIWVSGVPVYVPTKEQSYGEWSCRIIEDAGMGSNYLIQHLWRKQILDVNGTVYHYPHGIRIYLIDDLLGGYAPVMARVLKNVWLKKIEPLNLSGDKATEPIEWGLTFRYNGIEIPGPDLHRGADNYEVLDNMNQGEFTRGGLQGDDTVKFYTRGSNNG